MNGLHTFVTVNDKDCCVNTMFSIRKKAAKSTADIFHNSLPCTMCYPNGCFESTHTKQLFAMRVI